MTVSAGNWALAKAPATSSCTVDLIVCNIDSNALEGGSDRAGRLDGGGIGGTVELVCSPRPLDVPMVAIVVVSVIGDGGTGRERGIAEGTTASTAATDAGDVLAVGV